MSRLRRGGLLLGLVLLATSALGSDYYDILHVSRNADAATIKRAYRKVALTYHPDKVQGGEKEKEEAAKKFAEIGHAYEVLSDPEQRQIYDRYGEEGLKGQGTGNGGQHFDPNDIFSRFFGGGGFGGGFGGMAQEEDATPKGASVRVDVHISLEDAFSGTSVEIVRDKGVIVPAPGKRKCKCRQKIMTQQVGPGMYQQYTTQVCDECPNVALVRERERLTLHVDPGVPNGHVFSFFEEGEPLVDGEAGDLLLRVICDHHSTFERRGDGLLANLTISLLDALVGFEHALVHLDGHVVQVGAPDQVTTPGQIRWFQGEGMPRHDSAGRGDLWITYHIDFPEKLDGRAKQLAREMLGGGGAEMVHAEL